MIPGSANPLLLKSAAAAGPVQIERSLRFNSSDSAYLSRTPASAGNRKTWTWAGWVKRSAFGGTQRFFIGGASGAGGGIQFESDTLFAFDYPGSFAWSVQTSAVFRDPSSWYHVVLALDTTQATSSHRVKLYVNGSQQTALTATYPTPNYEGYVNAGSTIHTISSLNGGSDFFSGYLADIHFIDGQALTPSSFTEVSATTGQLIPKAYTGSFGTNGFWLKFSDNSNNTATTLGKDTSGNSNNWTPNNLSVTAGAGNDSLVDTPTSFGTDAQNGGEMRGNYCVLNAVNTYGSTTLSNGNLEATLTTGGGAVAVGTIAVSSGKWYWEVTPSGSSNQWNIGIADSAASNKAFDGPNGWYYYADGRKVTNLSYTSYGSSFTGGDVIGVALDMDAGTVTFYKNNTSQGTAFNSGIAGKLIQPALNISATNSNAFIVNFGARAFSYQAPSGFKALCDTNLPAPVVAKPNEVMDVKLYTGNGSTQTISGLGFSPDFVWIKERNSAENHQLQDIVRGATNRLFSNLTAAESADAGSLTSFNSDGFSLGSAANYNGLNDTYVAWAWDAGSSTVTNTQGSITSQVRANASAGFSVVTFNSGGSNGEFSVGHGLNVAPRLIIMKSRTRNGGPWWVHHLSATDTTTKYLQLSTTSAVLDNGGSGSIWGAALPTSTVFGFSVGTGRAHTQNEDIVSYCFAPVAGYSSFGSYTGNGSSDGPFVYTGFRPKWILFKRSSAVAYWGIYDAVRNTYNAVNLGLYPNDSIVETSDQPFDFLSNGFKVRGTTDFVNLNAATYVYAAFAESPFQYSRAR